MFYTILADLITAFHFGYVAFVVVGELLILLGWVCRWRWVRNPWFRGIHLLAIAYVAAESLLHVACPLTTWEGNLRELAAIDRAREKLQKQDLPVSEEKLREIVEQETDHSTFMERLVHFFFMDGGEDRWPEEVYEYMHIAFGVLVLLTIVVVPPRFRRAKAVTTPPAPEPDQAAAASSPQAPAHATVRTPEQSPAP
jgi:hypothetical protein